MTEPILYEFPHSHFCEVARWALEYKGISYRSECLLPGFHIRKIKRIAKESSVPVLVDRGQVVQGSAAIVDYLDQAHPDRPLTPAVDARAISALEEECARTIGVPIRRLCYYHLLPRPALVRFFFMHRSGILPGLVFRLSYDLVRKRITEVYDCPASGAASARAEIAAAIEAFDQRLAQKQFLHGDSFSRADMTFAALLALMVMPPEYPVTWPKELGPLELTRWFAGFRESRSYQHVAFVYANYRRWGARKPARDKHR